MSRSVRCGPGLGSARSPCSKVTHRIDLGQLVNGADEASAEQRRLPGETRERGIAIRELDERLAVCAPRCVAQKGEVVEVPERLEGLHALRAAFGELDRPPREVILTYGVREERPEAVSVDEALRYEQPQR